jgi:hypothetical protein
MPTPVPRRLRSRRLFGPDMYSRRILYIEVVMQSFALRPKAAGRTIEKQTFGTD